MSGTAAPGILGRLGINRKCSDSSRSGAASKGNCTIFCLVPNACSCSRLGKSNSFAIRGTSGAVSVASQGRAVAFAGLSNGPRGGLRLRTGSGGSSCAKLAMSCIASKGNQIYVREANGSYLCLGVRSSVSDLPLCTIRSAAVRLIAYSFGSTLSSGSCVGVRNGKIAAEVGSNRDKLLLRNGCSCSRLRRGRIVGRGGFVTRSSICVGRRLGGIAMRKRCGSKDALSNDGCVRVCHSNMLRVVGSLSKGKRYIFRVSSNACVVGSGVQGRCSAIRVASSARISVTVPGPIGVGVASGKRSCGNFICFAQGLPG